MKIPRNWTDFICDSEIKTELFHFLSSMIASRQSEKILVSTLECNQVTDKPEDIDLSQLQPYSHEEFDTTVLLYS